MENDLICLDTSILIDYFRKKKKENSFFFELTNKYTLFAVLAISEYEVYMGSNPEQDIFWDNFFKMLIVLPFTSEVNKLTIKIVRQLKRKGLNIDIPDLFIGSTALYNNLN